MEHKLIVTHISPDLDAVTSVWLLKKFDPQRYSNCSVAFVPAGETISTEQREFLGFNPEEVVHVDTGRGIFDHHTEALAKQRICAASLVLDHLVDIHPELDNDEALHRLVDHVVGIDHFQEAFWPEPNHDRYFFQLHEILSYLKNIGKTDSEIVEYAQVSLEAVYTALGQRVQAEEEFKLGIKFTTIWGPGIGFNSTNADVERYAQLEGFSVVVRKDPDFGHARIKAKPDKDIDLSKVYEIIIGRDAEATWYLHPSKAMLLNGSRKNQNHVPSSLALGELIEIIKQVS